MSIAALVVKTEPASLPISLAEAKSHCRVTHNLDDQYLTDCIESATKWAEVYSRRKLVTQTVEIYSDGFPLSGQCFYWPTAWNGRCGVMPSSRRAVFTLPGGYVQAVNQIDYTDQLGVVQTLTGPSSAIPGTDYQEDLTDIFKPIVTPPQDSDWPIADDALNAVRIEYVVGWEPDKLPQDIRHAIKVRVANMYVNRYAYEKIATESAENLLYPYVIFYA